MDARNEKGFTLIEVLIVGIIVTIMAAVALPRMGFVFSKNKLRTSTTAVTSSLYLARMKAVNEGEDYGVEFFDNGEIKILRDPLVSAQVTGATNRIEEGIEFTEITFNNALAVFTPFGQLDKSCLPSGELVGRVTLVSAEGESTKVEVTLVTGRIRETNL